MKIIAFTDIHGNTRPFQRIPEEISKADVVVLAGDITNFGREKEARQVVDAIQVHNCRILAVPGNCDYPDVERFLSDEGINLDCDASIFLDVSFVGVGGSLPCPGKTPNEYSEEDLEACIQSGLNGIDTSNSFILVAHQPPISTICDRAFIGAHVGSSSIRTFIEKHQPIICITGHIHEGKGVDKIGQTHVVNPGPMKRGNYVEIDIIDDVVKIELHNTRDR